MRIVHVLHNLGTGGLERGVAKLVRHGSPGFEHAILCLSTSGATEKLLPSGIQVVKLGKQPGNSLSFLWKIAKALKNMQPDVIHTRNWAGIDGIIAARLARMHPIVHGEHGWEVLDPDGKSTKRVRTRRFLSRWVREYTCVSRHIEAWLHETVRVRGPVTQIYNGVETEKFRPGPEGKEIRSELGLRTGAPVIGIVSRLDPIKDHPTLFRAFSSVRERHPEARLLVVGAGPEQARLEAQVGPGALLLGDRKDVPRVLRALDVFVLSSQNEGISNTILEAMATGLPVVVTNVGGNPELVEDGLSGRLVPAGNPSVLASAMSEYLGNAELRKRDGDAARRRVQERFSVDAMVKGYEAVWMRADEASTRPRR